MYIYFMVLGISLITAICNVLLKKYQLETKETVLTMGIFNFINAITAVIFFLIVNRFVINMNGITLLFSFTGAAVVALNILANVFALAYVSLLMVSIITTAGTIIGTSLFGSIFLSEHIGVRLFLSMVLIITAVSLPFIKSKLTKSNTESTISTKGIFISIFLFVMSALNVIQSKLYAINPYVCDSNSYFFMMNFILVIVSLIVVMVYKLKNCMTVREITGAFTVKKTLYVSSRTLISNIGAMITMIVLTKMDVSLYSVLTSSFAIIGNGLASRYYFKEKMGIESKIAIILVIVAIILTY